LGSATGETGAGLRLGRLLLNGLLLNWRRAGVARHRRLRGGLDVFHSGEIDLLAGERLDHQADQQGTRVVLHRLVHIYDLGFG